MNAYKICTRALRRIGVLAQGEVPDEDTLNDAIDTLKEVLLRAVGEGALGSLTNEIASAGAHQATPFSRVVRNNIDTTSIDLPDTITDDCTGEARTPFDGSVIAIADQFSNETVTYVYDEDVAQWLGIETIDSTSEVPLAERDANGLASYIGLELADEYGLEVPEATAFAARRWQNTINTGFSREQRVIPRPENYF